jgi:hypothetical protein
VDVSKLPICSILPNYVLESLYPIESSTADIMNQAIFIDNTGPKSP